MKGYRKYVCKGKSVIGNILPVVSQFIMKHQDQVGLGVISSHFTICGPGSNPTLTQANMCFSYILTFNITKFSMNVFVNLSVLITLKCYVIHKQVWPVLLYFFSTQGQIKQSLVDEQGPIS